MEGGDARDEEAHQPPLTIPALELPPAPEADPEESAEPAAPFIQIELQTLGSSGAPRGTQDPREAPLPLAAERTGQLLQLLPPSSTPGDVPPWAPQDEPGVGATPTDPNELELVPLRAAGADSHPDEEGFAVRSIVPAGPTDLAPHLTIVFSEPMIPLGRDGEATDVPASLDPQPPGSWRWLDVRTLRFEPREGRLPGATAFSVRIPAHVRSASGEPLGDEVLHAFRTRGPRAVGGRPHEEVTGVQPLILLVFDQEVRSHEVLASARLTSEDGVRHPLREARTGELDAEPRYLAAAERAGQGRWAALRPADPLPAGTGFRLELGGGLASAEGPLPMERRQELSFSTRGPFGIQESECTDPSAPCTAFAPWTIRLTSPLPEDFPGETAPDEVIRIEPAGTPFALMGSGQQLRLFGEWQPFTTYRVELLSTLQDRFGASPSGARSVTAHFGAARPSLEIEGGPFLALDPSGSPTVHIASRAMEEMEVEIFRVGVADWPAYLRATHAATGPAAGAGREPTFDAPGERVSRERIDPGDGGTRFLRTPVDLSGALPQGRGHAVVLVRGRALDGTPAVQRAAWVQASALGIHAQWDPTSLTARVWALADRRPLEGAEVWFTASGARSRTDLDGYARLPLHSTPDTLLVARVEGDTALLPSSEVPRQWGGWVREDLLPRPLWYAVTDRELYRPGEEAYLQGWIRRRASNGTGPVTVPGNVEEVRFEVQPSRGDRIAEGTARVSPDGHFHVPFSIPRSAAAGRGTVRLTALEGGRAMEGWSHTTRLHVAEFRRPEYEVRIEVDPGPHLAGDPIELRALARYFDGPGLPDAPVSWRVAPTPTPFTPPGWHGWSFGHASGIPVPMDARRASIRTLEGRTNEYGAHEVRLLPRLPVHPYPVRLTLSVEARDLDHDAGSGSAEILLHPGQVHAGLRAQRGWLTLGDRMEVEVAVADLEGRLVEGLRPTVTAQLLDGTTSPLMAEPVGEPMELPCRPAVRRVAPEAEGPILVCELEGSEAGRLRVAAEVSDGAGRLSRSETDIRVEGPPAGPHPPSTALTRGVEVIPEKSRYEPGDTARFLVVTPRREAEGTLALVGAGIRSVVPFRVRDGSATVAIPLAGEGAGTYRVHVELAGGPEAGGRTDWALAAFLVSAEAHRLEVEVVPEREVAGPAEEVAVEVRVRDALGRPAPSGQVTLWAVDEAILERAAYQLSDPVSVFHERMLAGGFGRSGLQQSILWERRAAPRTLSARFLDGRSGAPARTARVRLEELGLDAPVAADGELEIRGLEPGPYTVIVEWLGGESLRRSVVMEAGGVDLGLVLLEPPTDPTLDSPSVMFRMASTTFEGEGRSLSLDELPPPPELVGVEEGIAVRRDFTPLAAFEPALELDADGLARTVIRLPDTMTRYRIFAVATRGSADFGMGEGVLTARRDLVVRLAPPAFLRPGDASTVPVLIQNASAEDMEVEVVARASGLELEPSSGARLRVPAGDRREVGIPVRAGLAGEALLEVLAVAGDLNDAVARGISIRPPISGQLVAVQGELSGTAALRIPVEIPEDAVAGFGEIEISASGSVLHRLVDALWVLCREPVPWPEPTVARVLAVASLANHLDDLAVEALPSPDELRAGLHADAALLTEMLEPWIRNRDPGTALQGSLWSPFLVTFAIEALLLAEEAGVEVPPGTRAGLSQHLEGRLDEAIDLGNPPPVQGTAAAAFAHTLYVAAALGVAPDLWDRATLRWLGGVTLDDLPVEALSWLLVPLSAASEPEKRALADEILRVLENRAVQAGPTVTFRQGVAARPATPGPGGMLLASHRRTDAVALSALLEVQPHHDLVPGLARGLLAHRDGSAHGSLYESAWGLMALGRYVGSREGEPSSMELRGWLAGRVLGTERIEGSGRAGWTVPLDAVLDGENGSAMEAGILLRTEGSGTLHYRAALRHAPVEIHPDPLDRGFVVSRRYEAVDREDDVVRDPDGTWRLRAGARVRVRLSVTAPTRRSQVQLQDPIPAGLEILNPSLAGVGFTHDESGGARGSMPSPHTVDPARGTTPWWLAGSTDWTELYFRWRILAGLPWYTHQEFRQDRMEAYVTFLPAGSFDSSYLMRAVVPGEYRVPPPRIEELDHPEVFGRGTAERVVVEVREGG